MTTTSGENAAITREVELDPRVTLKEPATRSSRWVDYWKTAEQWSYCQCSFAVRREGSVRFYPVSYKGLDRTLPLMERS
jgi:hypothetical protein